MAKSLTLLMCENDDVLHVMCYSFTRLSQLPHLILTWIYEHAVNQNWLLIIQVGWTEILLLMQKVATNSIYLMHDNLATVWACMHMDKMWWCAYVWCSVTTATSRANANSTCFDTVVIFELSTATRTEWSETKCFVVYSDGVLAREHKEYWFARFRCGYTLWTTWNGRMFSSNHDETHLYCANTNHRHNVVLYSQCLNRTESRPLSTPEVHEMDAERENR